MQGENCWFFCSSLYSPPPGQAVANLETVSLPSACSAGKYNLINNTQYSLTIRHLRIFNQLHTFDQVWQEMLRKTICLEPLAIRVIGHRPLDPGALCSGLVLISYSSPNLRQNRTTTLSPSKQMEQEVTVVISEIEFLTYHTIRLKQPKSLLLQVL